MKYENRNKTGRAISAQKDGEVIVDDCLSGTTGSEEIDELATASVGCSVEVGESASYGSNKYSVSVWCTEKCRDQEAAKAAAMLRCQQFCADQASSISNSVKERFFPGVFPNR